MNIKLRRSFLCVNYVINSLELYHLLIYTEERLMGEFHSVGVSLLNNNNSAFE